VTIITDRQNLPTSVAESYRAKDDVANRTVLITGAIDSNDHDILVRVELPAAGTWHVVKSETNLTDRSWCAWQITFGEGTTVVPDSRNLCRQFDELFIAPDRERLCFFRGEIRPGEAVLKTFTVETTVPRIVMAHNRPTEEEEDGDDIDFPTTEPDAEFMDRIRDGFAPKPYIEAFLPVTRVNA
jgi:Family of unknown function (DUF6423)